MINRTQRISLGVASVSAAFLVVTLFLPWMGFTYGGDISKSSSEFISQGGLTRPLSDQTAFDLSGPLAAIIVLIVLAVILVSLAAGFTHGLIADRVVGWACVGAGVAVLIASGILVYGVESNPLDVTVSGGLGAALLDWGPLIGAKLAAVGSIVLAIAGAVFIAADGEPATSPEHAPVSAA